MLGRAKPVLRFSAKTLIEIELPVAATAGIQPNYNSLSEKAGRKRQKDGSPAAHKNFILYISLNVDVSEKAKWKVDK